MKKKNFCTDTFCCDDRNGTRRLWREWGRESK